MPKSRKRKKTKSVNRVSGESVAGQEKLPAGVPRRAAQGKPGMQNVLFSAMIALGFWGLAIFCVFFYVADPNHYLYGAIMGLTAVGWTVMVVRRWLTYRQRA